MSKSQRVRSRFLPLDLAAHFKAETDSMRTGTYNAPSRKGHFVQHTARTILYTSPATITVGTGTTWYPTFPGAIIGMRINVVGAPTTTLTIDLLLNGVSVFGDSTDVKPTIAIGSVVGYKQVMSKAHFAEDDSLQISIIATGGATGPLVVTIDYFNEG